MENKSDNINNLYSQETDLQVISLLLPFLKEKNFIDVGAEKGSFANALLKMGFIKGTLFEPMPSHLSILNSRFNCNNVTIFPYAIDSKDRNAEFNIACSAMGEELDYFHSLNKIENNQFFKHSKILSVTCRSLSSLIAAGDLEPCCGVLKIDTEGNDLKVIQGIGEFRPEIIVCEYVPPSIYPDWSLSFSRNLVPAVREIGYSNFVAAQKTHGVEGTKVLLNPSEFTDDDWGNLIFISNNVFDHAHKIIEEFVELH